jgi:hypothetical protein
LPEVGEPVGPLVTGSSSGVVGGVLGSILTQPHVL